MLTVGKTEAQRQKAESRNLLQTAVQLSHGAPGMQKCEEKLLGESQTVTFGLHPSSTSDLPSRDLREVTPIPSLLGKEDPFCCSDVLLPELPF